MSCLSLIGVAPAVFSWGNVDPSQVTLRPDAESVAVVEFRNTLTPNSPMPFRLTLGGLEVLIDIEFGAGLEPEVLEVVPPEGFIAVPPVLVVRDYTTGVVRILCAADMGLG